jgi:hypothetical protein
MHRKFKFAAIAAAAIVPVAAMALGALAAGGNLLTNGTFDATTAGWNTVPGLPTANVAWSAGHARVTNTSNLPLSTMAGVAQCVDIQAAKTYVISGAAYVAGGQDRTGGAETRVFFYGAPDCGGVPITAPSGSYLGSTPETQDTWVEFDDAIASPVGAVSANVTILATKNKAQGLEKDNDSFAVLFDNLSFSLKLDVLSPKATATPAKTVPPIIANPKSTPTATATPGLPIANPTTATPSPTATPPAAGNEGNGGNGGTTQGADAGSGSNVTTLGETAATAAPSTTPDAPSTGSGNQQAAQGGLIGWPMFALMAVGVLALAGLIVTLGTLLARRDDDDEPAM